MKNIESIPEIPDKTDYYLAPEKSIYEMQKIFWAFWVSVKKELPKEGQQVLVYSKNARSFNIGEFFPILTAVFKKGEFLNDHFCESSSISNVTYWMRLPHPPSGDV